MTGPSEPSETIRKLDELDRKTGCPTCGRERVWHGSEHHPAPGTYLSEMGCHDGVRMDDDEYHEGWQPDTIYPPCPHSPLCCKVCGGDGQSRDPKSNSDDCGPCKGTGWKDAKPHWPGVIEEEARAALHSPDAGVREACAKGYRLVPESALAWLFGEAPDKDGAWFGDSAEARSALSGKFPRRYWWRSAFRKMIEAAPLPVTGPTEEDDGWQTMESAPKDGTTIFGANAKLGQRGLVHMNAHGEWELVTNTPMGVGFYPTHWCPAPPLSQKEDGR